MPKIDPLADVDPKFRAEILQRWQNTTTTDQRLALWDDAVKAGILSAKGDLIHKLAEIREAGKRESIAEETMAQRWQREQAERAHQDQTNQERSQQDVQRRRQQEREQDR